jgi:hypothetical protein
MSWQWKPNQRTVHYHVADRRPTWRHPQLTTGRWAGFRLLMFIFGIMMIIGAIAMAVS